MLAVLMIGAQLLISNSSLYSPPFVKGYSVVFDL